MDDDPLPSVPDEELGVELDQAVDRRIAAVSARNRLERMHVDLDSIADSRIRHEVRMEVREMQQTAGELMDRLDDEIDRLDRRLEVIRDRME